MRSRHTGRGRNLFCLPSNIFVAFVVIVVKLHTENQPVASHQNLFQGSNRKGIVSVVLAKPCEDVGLNVTVSISEEITRMETCVVVDLVALLPTRKLGI